MYFLDEAYGQLTKEKGMGLLKQGDKVQVKIDTTATITDADDMDDFYSVRMDGRHIDGLSASHLTKVRPEDVYQRGTIVSSNGNTYLKLYNSGPGDGLKRWQVITRANGNDSIFPRMAAWKEVYSPNLKVLN
jgi:hypothetical protein